MLDSRDGVVQHYAPLLRDMQIKWATVYGGDELQVTRVAKYLLDGFGIYSNLRVQDHVDRPKSADFYRALTELCLQQGIPPYVQIFNEPEDGREWEGSPSTETFGYNWRARAEAVAQAGGYPGLQVLSREFFDAAMNGVSDRVRQRMYFSLHNYGANHPPAYPYPQATVMEDDTAVLRFLEYAHWFRSAIGFVPPIIGGEGGWLYQNHDDASKPAVTIDLWVPWHEEMCGWFRTGRLSNGEVLPDYLFSVSPWLLYAANWYSDSWVDGLHKTRIRFVRNEAELESLPLDDDEADAIVGSKSMNLRDWIEEEAIHSRPLVPRHEQCGAGPAVEADAGAARQRPFTVFAALKCGAGDGNA